MAELNRKFLGKEYHSGPQLVDPESIRKYALATNEKNSKYLSAESDVDLVTPPIYPVVFLPDILSQLVDDAEEMNFDIYRVVHAEHKMSWKSALHAGDEIYTTAKIINMEKRGANEIVDLQIRCTREDEPVVEMNYRLLSRGEKRGEGKRSQSVDDVPTRGKNLAVFQSVVTADQGVRYAEASGDHNPIHVNEEVARRVGLPGTILHGLCTMALASQGIVDNLLDGDPTRLKTMSVRFSKPVLLDQTLTTEVYGAGKTKEGLQVVEFETRDRENVPVLTLGKAAFEP